MIQHLNERRHSRVATAIASAALAFGALGATSELAAAGERTEPMTAIALAESGGSVPRATDAPRQPVPADQLTRSVETEGHFPGLHALAVYLQQCLDDLDAGACAKGAS